MPRQDSSMPRGYMEGPAAEEAEARLDELERGRRREPPAKERPAVYGSTRDEPERHFIGWAGDGDPGQLFASREGLGPTGVRPGKECRAGGGGAPPPRADPGGAPCSWPPSFETAASPPAASAAVSARTASVTSAFFNLSSLSPLWRASMAYEAYSER